EKIDLSLWKHMETACDDELIPINIALYPVDEATLLKKIEDVTFPEEFLKRWLIETNQGKIDEKEITDNFAAYRDSIKWQLIEGKIIDTYKLDVSSDELKEYYKTALVRNYFPVPADATEEQIKENEEAVEKVATNMLENKEQSRQVYEFLFEQKLTNTLKAEMKHKNKSVTTDEFAKIITK
ncbi:MAG: hypothetical protein U0K83_03865, partial [Bacteroidales bacterium]|nr:hypothetical protein [Bacteroidales bacterium]